MRDASLTHLHEIFALIARPSNQLQPCVDVLDVSLVYKHRSCHKQVKSDKSFASSVTTLLYVMAHERNESASSHPNSSQRYKLLPSFC